MHVDEVSDALQTSAAKLSDATELLTVLQQEMAARQKALAELNEQVRRGDELASVSAEATAALDAMIERRMARTERRIGRLAWWQGAVWALFGALVAVLATIYAERLSHYADPLSHPMACADQ